MFLSVISYLYPRNNVLESQHSYSTNNSILAKEDISSFHPKLQSLFQQLDTLAPRFLMKSGDIEIINSPEDFYNLLKKKIESSNKRIFLSSLYIGKSQYDLVDSLERALAMKEDLKLSILTDSLRGTRESPQHCSASLLAGLVEKFGRHRVDLRMYHTPHLSGLTKSIVPKRLNEGYGLQHMKIYGFDDELILSGANLSQDYFVNRQDRYYLFKNKPMTDYYFNLQKAISSLSYEILSAKNLAAKFQLDWPTSNKSSEPHMNLQRFLSDSSFLLEPLLKQQQQLTSFNQFYDHESFDTIVYPISQLTPLLQIDNSTEKPAILRLLAYMDSPKIKWWFTAGYFNMLPEIQERLLQSKAVGSVITASPQANSFYKSSGISYYLPEAYLLFAKNFLAQVKKLGSKITVFEWKNGVVNTPKGWSYHAKGLWLTVPGETEPSITVIGSSNYTKRAYSLDLESNALIITKDQKLKQSMKDEIDNLMQHAKEIDLDQFQPKVLEKNPGKGVIDEDRKISMGVKLAVKVIGGKL